MNNTVGFSPGLDLSGDANSYQDVSEPGATHMEVSWIWRMKFFCEQSTRYLQSPKVQTMLGAVCVLVLTWLAGSLIVSVIPSKGREVSTFLKSLGLQNYSSILTGKGYIYLEDLMWATDDDLQYYVGIANVAHRKRIIGNARKLMIQTSALTVVLRALFFLMCVTVALLVVGLAIGGEIRNRVVCALVFWGLIFWYRLRMYRRIWRQLDLGRRPRVHSVVVEAPAVVEHDFEWTEILNRRPLSEPESPQNFVVERSVSSEVQVNGDTNHRTSLVYTNH